MQVSQARVEIASARSLPKGALWVDFGLEPPFGRQPSAQDARLAMTCSRIFGFAKQLLITNYYLQLMHYE